MTRHTTIHKSELSPDVRKLFEPGCFTVGVPMTAEMVYTIMILIHTELYRRKRGKITCETGLPTEALRRLALLMDRAGTDISVLRDTPQRGKR